MSKNTSSDVEADSDFDERDLAVEEEDDSIAPDEDIADDEEVDSLVKESQMSLEELLASYGLSVDIARSKMTEPSDSVFSSTRSRRLRPNPQSSISQSQSPEAVCVTDPDIPNKRTCITHSDQTLTESAFSSPGHNTVTVSNDFQQPELLTPPTHEKKPTPMPSSTASVLDDSGNARPWLKRRSISLSCITSKESAGEHSCPITSTSEPSEVRPLVTQCSSPVDYFDDPSKGDGDDPEGETSDTPKDDSEESRNSGTDGEFATKFWQRAIGAEESPPSYNSDDDEDYAPSVDSAHDWRSEIRVGDDYQARVPPISCLNEFCELWDSKRFEDESCCLWQPGKLPEAEVIHFERLFAQSVMFPLPLERTVDDEEALFLLMRSNYDTDEALQRLRFRAVPPSDIPGYIETWSPEDATAFEKGFALYSKDFRQIRETRLRHKTVSELVHYYYLWKKTARYDEFARLYRRDKRKMPHPNVTDFMDYLVLEQEAAAEVSNSPYLHASNSRNSNSVACAQACSTFRNTQPKNSSYPPPSGTVACSDPSRTKEIPSSTSSDTALLEVSNF